MCRKRSAARRRADGDSGEDESENAADGVFAAYPSGSMSFVRYRAGGHGHHGPVDKPNEPLASCLM
jgi:hypothetical protein